MAIIITPNNPRDYRGLPVATEGGPVQWKVQSTNSALNESVQISVSGDGFAPGTPPQIINFTAASANPQYATFTSLDDKFYEVDERFYFQFSPIGGAVVQAAESSGAINNNDRLPEVSISARQNTLLENATDPVFNFDLSRTGEDLTMATIVEIRFGGNGPTPADKNDFTNTELSPQLIRFEPGETAKTFELRIANDAVIESTESLDVQVFSATSTSQERYWPSPQYNPVAKYSTVISILNDDPNLREVTNQPPPPVDVYRFYKADSGTHFFTVSAQERDIINNTMPQYSYEGAGFQAVMDQPGADPIFRFYRAETGTHFFTPSVAERDSILANLPQYSYEGTGFHASNKDGAGLTEVYRFYKPDSGTHFYTPSILEKSTIESSLPQYKYEGVAFWVPDSGDYLLN